MGQQQRQILFLKDGRFIVTKNKRMNDNITNYKINNITVNKATVKNCWVMVYNNEKKTIVSYPTKIDDETIVETIYEICIKSTEEECLELIQQLDLIDAKKVFGTSIENAIQEIEFYLNKTY